MLKSKTKPNLQHCGKEVLVLKVSVSVEAELIVKV